MGRERRRWLGWLLAGLVMIALVGGFAFYRPFEAAAPAVVEGPDAASEPAPPAVVEALPGKRQTFLVMGVDISDNEVGRTDSMVVVSYDPNSQRLAMLSIPRDTWTFIPEHGYDKINHAYAFGGQKLAVDTVERLLGIDIDHYVTVSFEGFTNVIDAIGGVEINVEKRLYYEDPVDWRMGEGGLVIDIQPGLQTMDGLTALKYSRFRADEEGDIGRMRRQQQVIKALMKKAATPAVLARIPQLIPATASAIGTDLSVAEMLALAASGRAALSNPLVTGSVGGESRVIGGVFYLTTDLVASRSLAYEVLVGSKPDDAFLKQAEEEKAVYQATLREAMDRAAAATDQANQAGGATAPSELATTDEGESTTPSTAGEESAPSAPEVQQVGQITVAVIDATGKGIGREYAKKLRAAGFRVARITKSPKVLKRSIVIDHAGLQAVAEERLAAVVPPAMWVTNLDPQAEEALEILLGTDLLQ